MSVLFDDHEVFDNEGIDMGSINHSLAQATLSRLLGNDERFTVLTELSLDIKQYDFSMYGIKAKEEVKPDVCVYSYDIGFQRIDIVRMTEIPSLAIEILSPSQGTKELNEKILVYFELGAKSCWLVIPDLKLISIYTRQGDFTNFDMRDNEVVDEVMDIHLSMTEIFGKNH